jgi:hypothetical protein
LMAKTTETRNEKQIPNYERCLDPRRIEHANSERPSVVSSR